MALSLFSVATIPAGRRRGVVYATTVNATQVRRLAIPTQPTTNAATAATTSVGGLASIWGGLTLAQQASWTTGMETAAQGYALFIQLGQWALLWGTPVFQSNPGVGPVGGTGLAVLYSLTNGGPVTLELIYFGGLPPLLSLAFQVYYKPSAAFASPRPGFASAAPFGGTFTDTGFVYIGNFPAPGAAGITTYDVTAQVITLLGQVPAWAVNDPVTMIESGPLWECQCYVTTGDGSLVESFVDQPYPSQGAFNPPAQL
jgi:hypothetical protein